MEIFTSKIASRILILVLLIIVGLMNLYVFPQYEITYNNEKLISLDLRPSYNYEDVMELFTKMGDDGRLIYRYSAGFIDMIYPLVYGLLLSLLLLKLINHIFNKPRYYRFLLIIPFLIMFCDYSENLNTLKMLDAYPYIGGDLVRKGSFYSGIKWHLVSVNMVLILCGAIFLIVRLLFSKMKPGFKASEK